MAGEKKSKRNIIIGVVVVLFLFGAIGSCTDNGSSSSSSSDSSASTEQNTSNAASSTSNETSEPEAAPGAQTIELIAGEAGAYGKELIMSEGADMEERLIVFYVPAGDYTVENLGKYPTQVSVYEGVQKGVNGYDEYTNIGDIVMLEAGQTGDINVPEGWFIELHEPDHIALTTK